MLKRIFSAEDREKSFLIVFKAESTFFGARIFLLSDRLNCVEEIEFSNGVKFEKTTVNEVIDVHFDISNGIYARLKVSGKLVYGGSDKDGISAEKLFKDHEKNNENEKNTAKEKAPDQVFYDDYKIAEENYYELENEKDDNPENDDSKRGRQKKREEKRFRLYPFQDDEDGFAREEQTGRARAGDGTEKEQPFQPLYERGDKKEERGGLEKLLLTCQKEVLLENITGGQFARAKDESGKEFIVGKIFAMKKSYTCVGLDGDFSSPPDSSGDWFFIPKSPFNGRGAGFWLIFADKYDKRITPDKNTFG